MQKFTSTQLRKDTANVYNTVHREGVVEIEHRDRPRMFLVDQNSLKMVLEGDREKFNELLKSLT